MNKIDKDYTVNELKSWAAGSKLDADDVALVKISGKNDIRQ